jgi:hypothetical protein
VIPTDHSQNFRKRNKDLGLVTYANITYKELPRFDLAPTLIISSFLRQKALLHPVPSRTTGHIFYEPDAFDDVDPEDPDDDLDI